MFAVVSTFAFNYSVALPLLIERLGADDRVFGWLLSVVSFGSVIGSLLYTMIPLLLVLFLIFCVIWSMFLFRGSAAALGNYTNDGAWVSQALPFSNNLARLRTRIRRHLPGPQRAVLANAICGQSSSEPKQPGFW